MSVFHKTMVWLGLVDDDEYYADENDYYADEYGEPMPARSAAPARAREPRPPRQLRRRQRKRASSQ